MDKDELDRKHLDALKAIEEVFDDADMAWKDLKSVIDDVLDSGVEECHHDEGAMNKAFISMQRLAGAGLVMGNFLRLAGLYHVKFKHMNDYSSYEQLHIDLSIRHLEWELNNYRKETGRASPTPPAPPTPPPSAEKPSQPAQPADGWLERLMNNFKHNHKGDGDK